MLHIVEVRARKWSLNEGQKLSEYRISLAEERKKEKKIRLTTSGLVGRRAFWTLRVCVLVVFHV